MASNHYIRFLDRTSTRRGERHRALGLLELGPEKRCLDVGCGVGEDARAMSETSGAQVVGIDLTPRMVNEARSRSTGRAGVAFLVADAGALPFLESAFDAAWVKRTLMHIASPGSVMGEMCRVSSFRVTATISESMGTSSWRPSSRWHGWSSIRWRRSRPRSISNLSNARVEAINTDSG